MDFYFTRFEHRQPPEPLKTPRWVMLTWQVLAVASLILGANYIYWRWTASLNTDALWYAIPLVLAETRLDRHSPIHHKPVERRRSAAKSAPD